MRADGALDGGGPRRAAGRRRAPTVTRVEVETDRGVFMISVAAELANMHPQTLRMYEARGLIEPQRSPKGTRLYSQEDVEKLRRIQEMTAELGLNLAGVERVLDLEQEIEEMHERMEEIEMQALQAQVRLAEELEEVRRSFRAELVRPVPRQPRTGPRGRRALPVPRPAAPKARRPEETMQPDRFTIKSQEALAAAARLAQERSNPQVVPAHLLRVCWGAATRRRRSPGGVVPQVLAKLGVNIHALRRPARHGARGLPKFSAGVPGEGTQPSAELTKVLRAAEQEARSSGDEYVSTEHLLLALTRDKGRAGEAAALLRRRAASGSCRR